MNQSPPPASTDSNALAFAGVSELKRRLDAGEITSRQIVSTCLDRIAQHDAHLNSFIAVYADEALAEADACDANRATGKRLGPLHGIPIAMKDIIDIEGRVTTGGSKVWSTRVSPHTATLVRRAVDAGMIVIGKTRTVEFAMGSFGTNQHMGTPRNPWSHDVHRAPGGSSSGSGTSVAAGLVPCAIGTDTGGSVRIPASWCGLTGLKTTVGRISVHGVLPLATTLDTPGPMCRSVDDAALLFSALSGYDPNDAMTRLSPGEPDPWPTLNRGVSGLRIGRLGEVELRVADDDVRERYESSLELLGSLGAQIDEFKSPMTFQEMGERVGALISVEGYRFVGHLTDDPNAAVDEAVRPRINAGREASAADYMKMLEQRHHIRNAFTLAMQDFDAVLTPSTRSTAMVVDDIDQSGNAADYTRPFNLVDYCALSVPNGFSPNGLPTGLQIGCRGYDESMALQIGKCLQSHTDYHTQIPNL